ncbi:MAG: MSMEG_6728 family protein [Mycobacteriales bacterium]
MQTFVPYPDLRASCVALDDRRLGKQRVETFQILRALTWPTYAWKSHPAVTMWRGFVPGLVAYGLENCREWTRRGYSDSVAPQLLAWGDGSYEQLPPWFGLEALHLSHRSALVRKDPAYYRPLFPDAPDDLPYFWPAPVFPRWPVRADGPVELGEALRLLGYDEPWPGQGEAVDGVRTGRDVLLAARTGRSTAGLLAGLCTAGRTVWVAPPTGPLSDPVPEVDEPPWRQVDTAKTDAPPLARPPGPADQLAMADEHRPSAWTFIRPGGAVAGAYGLVVADGVTGPWQRPVDAPVLALVDRAGPERRAELVRDLGLRDPLLAGGGWDVGAHLAARPVTARSRAGAVAAAVRESGPALVVVAGQERVDRLTGQLVVAGLRAAGWAPGMRASRATEAIGAWRTKRLDALVVPAGTAPPLGRRPLPLLLAADALDLDAWRDLVAALQPAAAVLLTGPEADEETAAYARSDGCRRAGLIERYGEPVPVPCGRCEVCAR